MDSKDRAELIRLGNQAFNAKDYPKAKEFFTLANYSDGLIRLGDHYMYDRRLPLLAYSYYKKAGASSKVEDLHRRMVGAIGEWLGRDKLKPESAAKVYHTPEQVRVDEDGLVGVAVPATLKQWAENFLSQSKR